MSKELRKRGCNFVGSTICYAFMQATGMVNDHLVDCARWAELGGEPRAAKRAKLTAAPPRRKGKRRDAPCSDSSP